MTIHHVALGARDVERVATFYRTYFQLPERARHLEEGGALRSIWLDLSPGVLMIERCAGPSRPVEGIAAGPFLLAFAVDGPERLRLEAALARASHPIEARTAHTSYCRDPEGNRVAFSQYPLAEPAPPPVDEAR